MSKIKGPSRRWRSPAQLLADRSKVAHLYLRGESVPSIATIMGLSNSAVLHDLSAIREDWRKSAVFDFALARSQELARIDMVETEAWKAWENSKAPLETTNTRQRRRDLSFAGENGRSGDATKMPVDAISEANKRSVMRDPNPAFLERIAWCVEMRCKILGLIAPQEMRHSGTFTHIKEIHYQQTDPQSGSGRLIVMGGPPAALPTATPPDLAETYPDASEGDPLLYTGSSAEPEPAPPGASYDDAEQVELDEQAEEEEEDDEGAS